MLVTQGEDFLIGTIKEIPAVLTQGKTLEEVRENLKDVLKLYLEDMCHEQTEQQVVVYQEDLIIAAQCR